MKKILGVSLIAVLTAMPMMASAVDGEPVAGDPGATVAGATQAEESPGYSLAVQDSTKDGKMATAGYVKGAYNATIRAINRLSSDTATALNSKQDTISDISTIRTNAAAGAAAAENIGLISDLQGGENLVEAINAVKTTADAALTSVALEGYVTESDLEDAGYLTSTDLSNYATKQDVKTAINSATAAGTIDVLTTWGTDAETTVVINGTVSAAE